MYFCNKAFSYLFPFPSPLFLCCFSLFCECSDYLQGQMRGYYCNSQDNECTSTQLVIATELKPALKWLGHRASGDFESERTFEDTIENNYSNSLSLDDRSDDISDDEIEDW